MKKLLTILFLLFVNAALVSGQELDSASFTGAAGDPADTTSSLIGSAGEGPDSTSVSGYSEESAPEELYLTFKYDGMVNSLLTCYYKDETVFVPVQEIFDLLQINNKKDNNSLKGYFITNEKEYEINAPENVFSFSGEEFEMKKEDVLMNNGSVYMKPDLFKNGFNIDFTLDMENMELKLQTEELLPIVANVKRKNLRSSLDEKELAPETPLLFERKRSLFNGEFIDYFLSTSYSENVYPSHSYNVSMGNELLGGDLNINFTGNISSSYNYSKTNLNWRYVLGRNSLLNQVQLGTNLPSFGLSFNTFKGININNAPYQQQDEFGTYILSEKTTPNSDVELYMNNDLVDYVKADEYGNYKFEIPLTYGSNTLELKIYSPDGDLIESNRRLQIPFDFLKEQEFRYNASFGQKTDSKDLLYHANVGYGITSWLTNKVGVELTDNEAYNKPVFYNSLSARLSNDYLLNIVTAPELYHQVSFNATYYTMQSVSVKYTKYRENKLYNLRELKEDLQVSAGLPLNFISNRYSLQFGGTYEKTSTSKNYRFNVGGNFSIGDINPSFNYTFQESRINNASNVRRELSVGFNTPIVFLNSVIPYFEGKFINTTVKYDVDDRSLSSYRISFSNNLTENSRIELNYNNDIAAKYSSVNLLFKYEFPFTTTNVIASKNSFSANVHGTLGFDASEKNLFFSKKQSVGTSAVAFRMFYDENSNKIYDEGEMMLDDVNLNFAENVSFQRKENGVLMASELNPYHEYKILVKDLSPKNPYLIPKFDAFSLETDPNSVKLVDIPFYYSREVYGSIVAEKNNKTIPLPDMKILIKSLDAEKTISVNSFNDGSIYFLGLLPGKYEAYVNPAQVNMLSAVSFPEKIDFVIKENDNDPTELNFALRIGSDNIADDEQTEVKVEVNSDVAKFREKFTLTEKRINSKTGTPEENKALLEELASSENKALPEFNERYLALKGELDNWTVEAPQEEEAGGYTVVKGDCLWKISGMQQHYDNPHLWPAIWEANKDGIVKAPDGVKITIPNPNLIYPGQTIRIPKLTEESRTDVLNKEPEYYKIWGKKKKK